MTKATTPDLVSVSSAAKSSRIAWVDLLETISISMVVLYHCAAYIGGGWQPVSTAGFFTYYFLRSIFAVCVPLFFFVNGYLLFRQTFSLKKHLYKILKFVLIAIFWYAVTLLVAALLQRKSLAPYELPSIIAELKGNINHLWYLGALVCLYLLFPILKVTYDHHPQTFLYFTILCLVLMLGNSLLCETATLGTWVIGRPHVFSDVNFFSIFNPFRGLYVFSFAYFCLGGLVYRYRDQILAIAIKQCNLLAATLLAVGWIGNFLIGLAYSYLNSQVWDNVWHGYDSLWTLLAATGAFLLSLNWHRSNKLLSSISRNTLGIYLIHMLIIFLANSLFADFIQSISPLNVSSPAYLIILGNLFYGFIIFAISFVLSLLLRKTPFLRHTIS